MDQNNRATEMVECNGDETELEQCSHTHKDEGRTECKLSENIVSVSCVYDSLASCTGKMSESISMNINSGNT